MFRRTTLLAMAAVAIGSLFAGSEAMAQGRWSGGWGSRWGGGYGYAGGYYGGYGYPGSYGYRPYGYAPRYGSNFGSPYYGSSYYGSSASVYAYPGAVYASPSTVYANSGAYDSSVGYGCGDSSPTMAYATQDVNNMAHAIPSTADATSTNRITVAKPPIPDATTSAQTIKLKLPASAEGSVNYELNGTSFTMDPGYSQTFQNDRTWTLKFDDGTGKMQSQELQSGNFRFVKNSDGNWELQSF